jgi:hypothetical protein
VVIEAMLTGILLVKTLCHPQEEAPHLPQAFYQAFLPTPPAGGAGLSALRTSVLALAGLSGFLVTLRP